MRRRCVQMLWRGVGERRKCSGVCSSVLYVSDVSAVA